MNFLMKTRSQNPNGFSKLFAFLSKSHTVSDISLCTELPLPVSTSVGSLQTKERKHCHSLCSVPTTNAQLLSSSEHSGNRIQQHYVWKLTYITEHCTNLTLNDSDYGTGMSDILVVANCLRTKGHNFSKY